MGVSILAGQGGRKVMWPVVTIGSLVFLVVCLGLGEGVGNTARWAPTTIAAAE